MKRSPKNPLTTEMVLSAAKLTAPEARHLVSSYYAAQEMRKRLDMQQRHIGTKADIVTEHEEGEKSKSLPEILSFTGEQFAVIEEMMARALLKFSEGSPIGHWCLAQYGVGPVITGGLLAHLDIDRAPSVSHFWSFAGLNPDQEWKKGEKRPYNAELKQITFHLGECFKRTWKAEDSYYGHIYGERKSALVRANDRGAFAERAKTFHTNSAEVKSLLKNGRLPAGNLDRQAANYAAKIFLSHLHSVMVWNKHKTVVPPYAVARLQHVDLRELPHAEMFPGLAEAYRDCGFRRREAAE